MKNNIDKSIFLKELMIFLLIYNEVNNEIISLKIIIDFYLTYFIILELYLLKIII